MARHIQARWSATLAATAAGALIFWQHSARAGEGEIAPQADGTFEINAKIYQDLPRTQEEYDLLIEQLRGANRLVCDYTDGLFRLGRLEFVSHPAEKRAADIWWFHGTTRATAGLASFGPPAAASCDPDPGNPQAPIPIASGGRMAIYGQDGFTSTADTIAHEFGHLVFGLRDLYPDARATDNAWVRSVSIDGWDRALDEQRELLFYRSVREGLTFKEAPYPFEFSPPIPGTLFPVYPGGADGSPWWVANSSMMQQSGGQSCVNDDGLTPRQVNPVLWVDVGCASAEDDDGDGIADACANGGAAARLCSTAGGDSVVGQPCEVDSDCTTNTDPGVCSIVGFPFCNVGLVPITSELTTDVRNDLSRFNAYSGLLSTPVPPTTSTDGHVQEARHLVLTGYLYPSSDDAVVPEEMTGGQPGANIGGDVPCFDRKIDEETSFNASPAGVCLDGDDTNLDPDFCNPDILPGKTDSQFQCEDPGRGTTRCPGSDLALRECTVVDGGGASVGDPCETHEDCGAAGTPGTCNVTSRCTVTGGAPQVGDPCFSDDECGSLETPGVCDTASPPDICVFVRPPVNEGDPCTTDEDCGTTAEPGDCNLFTDVCTTIGGQPDFGDLCSSHDDCGSTNDPGVCAPGFSGSCSAVQPPPGIDDPCALDSGCGGQLDPGTCTLNRNVNGTSESARCDSCVIATSQQCEPPLAGLCGNDMVDSVLTGFAPGFEQCDNGDPSAVVMACSDLEVTPRMAGGSIRCQANCFYDLSECTLPLLHPDFVDEDGDGFVQLQEASRQSTAFMFTEAFDAAGKVLKPLGIDFNQGFFMQLGNEVGPSSHGVFTFFRRMLRYRVPGPSGQAWPAPASGSSLADELAALRYREVWQLVVGIEQVETSGAGFQGIFKEARRFELEFDVDYAAHTSALRKINGLDWNDSDDPADWPVVHLGFGASPAINFSGGSCHFGDPSDPSHCAATAQQNTGNWARQECGTNLGTCSAVTTMGISLSLDLRNLAVATVEDKIDLGDDTFFPILHERIFPIPNEARGTYPSFGGPVLVYARHGLKELPENDANAAVFEVPQYGKLRYRYPNDMPQCVNGVADPCCYACGGAPRPGCVNPQGKDQCQVDDEQAIFFDRFGFNQNTQRYESTQQTLDLLHRQFFGGDAIPGYGAATAQGDAVSANPEEHIDSDWTTLDEVMCHQFGIEVDPSRIRADGSQVRGEPPDDTVCPDVHIEPPTEDQIVEYNEDTQIVFVLDRSGSMSTKDTVVGSPPAPLASRLDYVKEAAKTFMVQALYASRADSSATAHGPKMGLVFFNHEPEIAIPTEQVQACTTDADCGSKICAALGTQGECTTNTDCTTPGETCIDGRCSTGGKCMDNLRFVDDGAVDANTEIALSGLFANLRLSTDAAGEEPIPGGATGTGSGLSLSEQVFFPESRETTDGPVKPTKIAVLLTDGLHNTPFGGHCLGTQYCNRVGDPNDPAVRATCVEPNPVCGGAPCDVNAQAPAQDCQNVGLAPGCFFYQLQGCEPTSYADATMMRALDRFVAGDPRILLYSIPLANEADRTSVLFAAGRAQGELFEAVRNYGEDTVPIFTQAFAATRGQQLTRTHIEPPVQTIVAGDGAILNEVYVFDVEPGARTISISASEYNRAVHPFNTAELSLVSPSGVRIPFSPAAETDPDVTFRPQSLAATLAVKSPEVGTWGVVAGHLSGDVTRLNYYVAVHVDNPDPVCYAHASVKVADGTAPIVISAQAFYQRPVISGVTYTGQLVRPDKVMVELQFTRDARTGQHQALVPQAHLVGRGAYLVNVRCEVAEGAVTDPGEPLLEKGEFDEITPSPFTREVATSFFLKTDQQPPLPGQFGNNQPQDVLDGIADGRCPDATAVIGRIFPPASIVSCGVPTNFAPQDPYIGDADGDGIDNVDEPPIDRDGDGITAPLDPDDNGTESPDGSDPDLPPGDGNPTSCGDGSGLDFGPWPMRSFCPSRRSSSPLIGPREGLVLWDFETVALQQVRSSAAVGADGTIYFGSNDNKIYALKKDGTVKWSVTTGGDVRSSPALGRNGRLYVGSDDNKVYALNMANGARAWTRTTGGDVNSSPVVGPDGTVYVGSDDGKVYALNPGNGAIVWSYQTGGFVDSSPALGADGILYVGSDDDYVYALKVQPGLTAAQRLVWKKWLGLDVEAIPAVGSGANAFIYVGSEADRMFKLDPANGNVVGSFTGIPDRDVDSSAAIAPDGSIVFGGDNNKVWALNPDLSVKWMFQTGGDVNSSPAIDGEGIVYVGADDDYLYALKPDAGLSQQQRLLFKVNLGANVNASPAIGADGVVYVGANSGKLFAIVDTGTANIPPEQSCSSATHNGHSYWFCTSKRSWTDARNRCNAVGISLVTIDNAAEDDFIASQIADDVWLGGSDQAQEGNWVWQSSGASFWSGGVGGTPVNGAFTDWEFGQPNDVFFDDCSQMRESSGRWTDDPCSNLLEYVCEDPSMTMGVRASFRTAHKDGDGFWSCAVTRVSGRGSYGALALLLGPALAWSLRRRRDRRRQATSDS